MTATVHTFPTVARLSWRQRQERTIHHNYALMDLLTKPSNSAANLHRQLKVLVPASCGHSRAAQVQDLVDRSEELKQLIEETIFEIGIDLMKLEQSLNEGQGQ
ncbi:hypothetical protein [Aquidulcibacter sp.]|uniref:hypothetical protein n=1 Tax=Aquidulcibacter sp. TaxID=2052990 RepID=UPI0025C17B8E|nr:hypothetical protein [Aquidulcibacter sp.]MCA3696512.1 hypothetical protein [Aquidulcibacter sp.]